MKGWCGDFVLQSVFTYPGKHLPVEIIYRNNTKRFEIGSELTMKTPERHQWRQCLYCLLWTYFPTFSIVYIVEFEQVNFCWDAGNISQSKRKPNFGIKFVAVVVIKRNHRWYQQACVKIAKMDLSKIEEHFILGKSGFYR